MSYNSLKQKIAVPTVLHYITAMINIDTLPLMQIILARNNYILHIMFLPNKNRHPWSNHSNHLIIQSIVTLIVDERFDSYTMFMRKGKVFYNSRIWWKFTHITLLSQNAFYDKKRFQLNINISIDLLYYQIVFGVRKSHFAK